MERRLAKQQAHVQRCMEHAGYEYPDAIPVPQGESVYDLGQITSSWWWAPRDDHWRVIAYGMSTKDPLDQDVNSNAAVYDSLTVEGRRVYDSNLQRCATEAESVFPASDPLPQATVLSSGLQERLDLVIASAAFDAAVARPYAACMSDAGYEVGSPAGVFQVLESEFDGVGLYRDHSSAADYERTRALAQARERQLATVDLQCRSAVADEIAALLAPEYEAWVDKNAAAVQEVAVSWSALLRQT